MPGELGASDLRLVNDLHEFVVTTRGRWREEPTVPIAEAPPVVVDGPAGNAHLDDTIDFDSDAGEQTPGKLDDDVRTVRGDRLTPLTLAENRRRRPAHHRGHHRDRARSAFAEP